MSQQGQQEKRTGLLSVKNGTSLEKTGRQGGSWRIYIPNTEDGSIRSGRILSSSVDVYAHTSISEPRARSPNLHSLQFPVTEGLYNGILHH